MSQYKQLTQEKRYAIYVLLQEKKSHRKIAVLLGVHHSTVSREIKRNSRRNNYGYRSAEKLTRERRQKNRCPTKLTHENIKVIVKYLRKHWSPEQVSGRLKREGILSISHETIYKYIRKDQSLGGQLYKWLRRKKKYRRRRRMQRGGNIDCKVSLNSGLKLLMKKVGLGTGNLILLFRAGILHY